MRRAPVGQRHAAALVEFAPGLALHQAARCGARRSRGRARDGRPRRRDPRRGARESRDASTRSVRSSVMGGQLARRRVGITCHYVFASTSCHTRRHTFRRQPRSPPLPRHAPSARPRSDPGIRRFHMAKRRRPPAPRRRTPKRLSAGLFRRRRSSSGTGCWPASRGSPAWGYRPPGKLRRRDREALGKFHCPTSDRTERRSLRLAGGYGSRAAGRLARRCRYDLTAPLARGLRSAPETMCRPSYRRYSMGPVPGRNEKPAGRFRSLSMRWRIRSGRGRPAVARF